MLAYACLLEQRLGGRVNWRHWDYWRGALVCQTWLTESAVRAVTAEQPWARYVRQSTYEWVFVWRVVACRVGVTDSEGQAGQPMTATCTRLGRAHWDSTEDMVRSVASEDRVSRAKRTIATIERSGGTLPG